MSQDPADAPLVADVVEDLAETAAAHAEAHRRVGEALAAQDLDPQDSLLDTTAQRIAAGVSEEDPYGKPGPPTSRWSPYRVGLFGGLGVFTAYGAVKMLAAVQSVLVLLLISGFLAVGLNPIVEWLERGGLRRSRAVGIVLVGVLIAFAGFLFAIVPPIVEQTRQFIEEAPGYLDQANQNSTIKDLDERFRIIQQSKAFLESPELAGNALGGVLGVGKVVFGAVFSSLTVLVLTLYFMSSLKSMKSTALRAVPRTRRARVAVLTDDILARVGGYVGGALTIAATAGITSFIVLMALDVPYPVALALVVLVTDLIPVIGATIGAVIVTAVAFTEGAPIGIAIGIFYLIYQQVENYVLYPRIMKRSVDVSPAVTIVAVLVGATLMGVVGALLAIPTAAAIQLILSEVFAPRQEAH